MEFRLGAGLESEVELLAVADDLFHHGAYLVHLDGVDDEILPLVAVLLGGFGEAVAGLLDAVVQDVGEAYQHGGGHVPHGQLVHQVSQVDLHAVFPRGHVDMSFLVDSKIVDSPSVDVVEFLGVFNAPFSHCVVYRFNSSRSIRTVSFILSRLSSTSMSRVCRAWL